MTVLGPLGPTWVAKVLILIGLAGILAAVIARAKGREFLPWLLYGLSLPIVALPHAIIAKRPSEDARAVFAMRPRTVAVVVTLALTNLVVLNYHRELFGRAWQYMMWESGVFESLTPINFLLGAFVFALAAAASEDRRRRWWLVSFVLADVVLAGEEVSWGQGQWLLDLDVPDFVNKYNPTTSLHNHILPGVGPIVVFFAIVFLFRVFYPLIQRFWHVPMPIGFLNAVLLTLLVAPLMRWDHEHYLFFDEVYEWSGSVLLLHLALYERWKWSFTR
jgi:hypothetical protein